MLWPILVVSLPFFVIPALMPGWRSLAAAVIGGGAVIVFLIVIGLTGGGAGQFLGLAAILMAVPCLACGALSGFMRLALSQRITSLPAMAAIMLAPPALLFAAFSVFHSQKEAKWRPPDTACLDFTATFIIGTSRIDVPMLVALNLYPKSDGREALYLQFPWVMRDLCQAEEERQRLQAAPTRLSAILADPSELERAPEILRRSACDGPNLPNWMNHACRPDSGKLPAIRKVGVLSLPDIDGAFFGVSGTTYAQYQSATGRLQPLPSSGKFQRARDNRFRHDYFVAEPGYWMDASGAPVSALCFNRQVTESLTCRSNVKLSSGLVLHYTFNARSDSFEADFRTADSVARSFVTMLGLGAD